jgi:hypothetical protein
MFLNLNNIISGPKAFLKTKFSGTQAFSKEQNFGSGTLKSASFGQKFYQKLNFLAF